MIQRSIHVLAVQDLEAARIERDRTQYLLSLTTIKAPFPGRVVERLAQPGDYVTVGEECENWFRNPAGQADLCDLVLFAQYHAFIGKPEIKHLPPVSKLPAFAKLGMSSMAPAEIVEFMRESRAEYDAIAAHLDAI